MCGSGRHNGNLTVMDDAAQRQWTARQQLDSKGRRDGNSTMMDEEERRERNGDVDTAGGGSDKGQHSIKIKI